MILFFSILVFLFLVYDLFTKQEKFGENPKGARLDKYKTLNNYKKNKFENISHTPMLVEGASYRKIFWQFLAGKNPNSKPKQKIPSKKINLNELDFNENVLVWFGHSSYFIQADGKKFLIDPVFSGNASPLSFTTKSFEGTDVYSVEDFPDIDYLILTHDHWDHLDHKTVLKLKNKVNKIITSLGVGQHLERWGFAPSSFIESNWGDNNDLEQGFTIHTRSARHFSGRTFTRAKTLWSSFVLKTPTHNLYLGGDSGYDTHFKEIGEEFGPFDLAILECGQYNPNWKYIHMLPEEVVQAALDLKAKYTMPVHWGKFELSLHDWNEPVKRAVTEAKNKNVAMVTPYIGEKVDLNNLNRSFEAWWLELAQILLQ